MIYLLREAGAHVLVYDNVWLLLFTLCGGSIRSDHVTMPLNVDTLTWPKNCWNLGRRCTASYVFFCFHLHLA